MTVPVYRPILLTKDGELQAVRELSPDVSVSFAPIFVVHPPNSTRLPAEHVDAIATKVAGRVPSSAVSLDTSSVDEAHDDIASHPLIRASEKVQDAMGFALAPVVTRAAGSTQAAAAAEVHRRHGAGVVVRLPLHSTEELIVAAERLDDLVDDLDVTPWDVDLVLDAADAADVGADIALELVTAAMEADPDGTRWRSVTLTASSFPRGVRSFPRDEVSRLPRRDWRLWTDVVRRMQDAGHLRLPAFGDYGISDPAAPDGSDPRYTSISTALRYSAEEDWLVAKGEVFNDGRGDSSSKVAKVARMIASHAEFKGSDFSAGDRWIADIAAGRTSETGNATTWRRVGTNHHITLVTRVLARQYGP
jgi:hypothetical protein